VHAVSVCVDFRHDETYFNLHCAGIKNLHLTHYVAVGQIVTWGVCFELVIAFDFKKKIMSFALSLIKHFNTECLKENTFPNSVVVFHYCCRKF